MTESEFSISSEEIVRSLFSLDIGNLLKTIKKEIISPKSDFSMLCQVYENNNNEDEAEDQVKGCMVYFFRSINGKPLTTNQASCEIYNTMVHIDKREFWLKPFVSDRNNSELLKSSAILSCKERNIKIKHPIICLFVNINFEKGKVSKYFRKIRIIYTFHLNIFKI